MIDYHIHIGQFNEDYFDPFNIFETIDSFQKITELHYSSTSTCRYDVELSGIEEEIAYAQSYSSNSLHVKPYLWFIPKYSDQNISIKSATEAFDYCGIKLHPFAHKWNLENDRHYQSLDNIFLWAHQYRKQVLIHCDNNKQCFPNRFENFFVKYKNAQVILAHSNPILETANLVNKYNNVYCDISCCSIQNINKLKLLVVNKEKILFGSDFPITQYINLQNNHRISLKEQYYNDLKKSSLL